MGIWRDTKERWLLAGAVLAFVLVCLINIKLPLLPALKNYHLAGVLGSEATANVASDLLIGLISAYMFYLVIDLLPRNRKDKDTLKILNLLVASVVDAYERTRIFGHETPITSIDTSTLDTARLNNHVEAIKKPGIEFLKLKFAMDTAHSRYSDFQHTLGLAANLSPEHALKWLVLSDKMRLLAEVYGTQPNNPFDENPGGSPRRLNCKMTN